jgi:hypothetical protein
VPRSTMGSMEQMVPTVHLPTQAWRRACGAAATAGDILPKTALATTDLDRVPHVKNRLATQHMTVLVVACFRNTGWASTSSVETSCTRAHEAARHSAQPPRTRFQQRAHFVQAHVNDVVDRRTSTQMHGHSRHNAHAGIS